MSRRFLWLGAIATIAVGVTACTQDFDRALLPKATACDGAAGARVDATCRDGACCAGCWDGTACQEGFEPMACGSAGAECSVCSSPASVCDAGLCQVTRATISLAGSARHTCAADRTFTLWCWGNNETGAAGGEEPEVPAPRALSAGEWIAVAAGGRERTHSCAIHQQGSLWCWGDNRSGQTGITEVELLRAPALLGGGTAWVSVAAGDGVTCGIRADTSLWCWGSSARGRNASEREEPEPARVGSAAGYTRVALGVEHGCAILNGELFCWGDDTYAQLGAERRAESEFRARPAPVANGSGFKEVAAGARHTCALRIDGSVECWGDGSSGQLGVEGPREAPTPVPTGGDFAQIAAGEAHTCAVHRDGTLFCWGDNASGQLGAAGVSASALPLQVGERRDWERVAAGYRHTCATTREGTLYCWGDGSDGQLGLGVESTPSPTALLLSTE